MERGWGGMLQKLQQMAFFGGRGAPQEEKNKDVARAGKSGYGEPVCSGWLVAQGGVGRQQRSLPRCPVPTQPCKDGEEALARCRQHHMPGASWGCCLTPVLPHGV